MNRRLVTVALVSALSFSVYLVTGGTVAEQAAYLTDGGIVPNRNATCPVRLDATYAQDAGLRLYQRLTFPVALTVLPDGGRDVQLPPMPHGARAAIDVMDWTDCTLAASTGPVAALWGNVRPFQGVVAAAKPWCRAKLPTLPCVGLDGGDMGDRNVGLCSLRLDPATCERISAGAIYAGDDPEKDVQ